MAHPRYQRNPCSRDSISEKVLNNAPNKDERFDSALPLIPGVVRGPDGFISMKGARASQGGSLLNGANATDPVTGIPDVRLPIDVVSSVEVISNPYDPEYGRLTGPVARTETRTGNYEGFPRVSSEHLAEATETRRRFRRHRIVHASLYGYWSAAKR